MLEDQLYLMQKEREKAKIIWMKMMMKIWKAIYWEKSTKNLPGFQGKRIQNMPTEELTFIKNGIKYRYVKPGGKNNVCK